MLDLTLGSFPIPRHRQPNDLENFIGVAFGVRKNELNDLHPLPNIGIKQIRRRLPMNDRSKFPGKIYSALQSRIHSKTTGRGQSGRRVPSE